MTTGFMLSSPWDTLPLFHRHQGPGEQDTKLKGPESREEPEGNPGGSDAKSCISSEGQTLLMAGFLIGGDWIGIPSV